MNSRSKFYFYFIIALILPILTSCEEKENDKYPDIPFFPNIVNPHFEIVKFESEGGLKFKNKIYQKYQNSGWSNDSIVVQDLDYNKLKTIIIKGYVDHIDESGQIFSIKDSNAYQYSPPKFI